VFFVERNKQMPNGKTVYVCMCVCVCVCVCVYIYISIKFGIDSYTIKCFKSHWFTYVTPVGTPVS